MERECSALGCGKMTMNKSRCNECGALATRVTRAVAELSEVEKEAWKQGVSTGRIDRVKFLDKANNVFGNELVKLLNEELQDIMIRPYIDSHI